MFKSLFGVMLLLLVFVFSADAQVKASEDADEQYRREIRDEMIPKYQKLHRKGVIMTSVGGALFGGGILMTAIGGVFIHDTPSLLYGNTNDDMHQKRVNGIYLVTFGPIAFLHGLVIGSMGLHSLNKAHKIRTKANSAGVQISYEPYVSPATNSYGMHFSMIF